MADGASFIRSGEKVMLKYIFIVLLIFLSTVSNAQESTDVTSVEKQLSSDRHRNRYFFVHKILPKLFFLSPEEAITRINQGDTEFIKNILNDLDSKSNQSSYRASDIEYTYIKKARNLFLLIKFPQPEVVTEAYYVALTIVSKEPRFFVLEKMKPSSSDAPDEAIFCEWDENGDHLNYGIGIRSIPTESDFMHLINGAVKGKFRANLKTEIRNSRIVELQ